MTGTTRTTVVFTVPVGSKDIPVGNHSGYVEHLTIHLQGQAIRSLARCMLHLKRADYPDFFSQNNSVIAADIDVTGLVKNGSVTYQ